MTTEDKAKEAIDRVLADAADEDEPLNRLKPLRDYIEQLMDKIL